MPTLGEGDLFDALLEERARLSARLAEVDAEISTIFDQTEAGIVISLSRLGVELSALLAKANVDLSVLSESSRDPPEVSARGEGSDAV
jgi:hypothetical protein